MTTAMQKRIDRVVKEADCRISQLEPWQQEQALKLRQYYLRQLAEETSPEARAKAFFDLVNRCGYDKLTPQQRADKISECRMFISEIQGRLYDFWNSFLNPYAQLCLIESFRFSIEVLTELGTGVEQTLSFANRQGVITHQVKPILPSAMRHTLHLFIHENRQ